MGKVRLGYVGCGFMAQKVHLPNFSSLPECELLALAEVRQELGQKVQARFGIPKLYADHQAMLADPDIEAVAVSAAFGVQGRHRTGRTAGGQGRLYGEADGDLAGSGERHRRRYQRSGKRLMVGYMKRYDAGNELVEGRDRRLQAER